jgi:sortase A
MTLTPNKAWGFLEWVLLFIGTLGLGMWAWAGLSRVAYQRWGDWSFNHRTRSSETDVPLAPDSLVGRVVIPRLGVNTLVREGTSDATLQVAAGHITGTAMPGRPGNVGIAAHRDSLFRGLRNVKTNDLIYFETQNGKRAYRVESTSIVQPADVKVLDPAGYRQLTLVTCYPFSWIGFAPERFIVKAREVSDADTVPVKEVPIKDVKEASIDKPPVLSPALAHDSRIYFEVPVKHSRTLAPGISLGVTDIDVASRTVDGWMWLMPDRRTIWLKRQYANSPLLFFGREDGRERDLVITSISKGVAKGYLVVPR